MKKANIVLDGHSTGVTIIEKMDFADVDCVFDVLMDSFHPGGLKDEEPDVRFLSIWRLFLISVGWTEDEYWDEWHSLPHTCPDCGEIMVSDSKPEDKPN